MALVTPGSALSLGADEWVPPELDTHRISLANLLRPYQLRLLGRCRVEHGLPWIADDLHQYHTHGYLE
jgi:hypothetical protein